MSCHEPHDPLLPADPKECRHCHGEIFRQKAVSHHTSLNCIQCHKTPEDHSLNPRSAIPGKPLKREFCGSCHGEDADSPKTISRVNAATHESGYLCRQCHYPHYPEAK